MLKDTDRAADPAARTGVGPVGESAASPGAEPTAGPGLRTYVTWAGKASAAIVDQGLFAGANFLVSLLMARWVSETAFGAFSVAYVGFQLVANVHASVLAEPMLVFGSGRFADGFGAYRRAVSRMHWVLSAGLALVGAAAAGILRLAGQPTLAAATIGAAVALPAILLQWLLRRAQYVRGNPRDAASGGAIYLAVMLVAVLALWRSGALTALTAFLAMGASSLAASAYFAVRLARGPTGPAAVPFRTALAAHWDYGRWAALTSLLLWVPTNIYYVLLPAFAGLAEVAGLRAAANLVMPVLHANSAVAMLLVPTFTRGAAAGGRSGLARRVRGTLAAMLLLSGAYAGLLAVAGRPIMSFLYDGRYDAYAYLLVGFALLPLSATVTTVFGAALRALEQPRLIFWSYLTSSVLALSVGFALVARLAAGGALAGLLLSSVVTGGMLVILYARTPVRRDGESP